MSQFQRNRKPVPSVWMLLSGILLTAGLAGCQSRTQPAPSPLPPSAAGLTLGGEVPPPALAHIAEWHPFDWRTHYLLGVSAAHYPEKVAHLRRADSLRPQEPCIDYMLVLATLEAAEAEDEDGEEKKKLWVEASKQAQAGAARHPRHAALHLLNYYLMARVGEIPQARLALNVSDLGEGFCFARLEEILVGLYDRAGRFNPYTLMEMAELYRSVPLPPFESLMDVLYTIFLEPLEQRPYDIRLRGRDAAVELYNLGYRLRTRAEGLPTLFSQGYERITLGYVLQLKAAEFLTLHHRAFGDTLESRRTFAALNELQVRYLEYLSQEPWESPDLVEFFSAWEALVRDTPEMTFAEAEAVADSWPLWRKAAFFTYPQGDEPPASLRPD